MGRIRGHTKQTEFLTFEKEDFLHEHHLSSRLCSHLLDTESPNPYTIGTISGIVLLNHLPDFSENEKRFLKALSSRCPIHHVCVTGSFRLGHHGAYVDDEIKPIVEEENFQCGFQHHINNAQPKSDDYPTDGIHILSF